jgi:hypothetical protein
MMKTYHHFAWKMVEWRKDPYCRLCKKLTHITPAEGSWKDQATVDHIVARGQGGSDEPENFQLLCGKCNNKKSKDENPIRMVRIDEKQLEALRKKSALLDALRKEGIKKLPIWEAAQLRLKKSIDNSGTSGYNPDGVSKVESE